MNEEKCIDIFAPIANIDMFSAKMIFIVEILPFITKYWYNEKRIIHYNLIKYKEIVNFDR